MLFFDNFKISRSLQKRIRKKIYTTSFDKCFRKVVESCAEPRKKDPVGGTWITQEMISAYDQLHAMGYAHSVETWHGNKLVGGLYGLAIGRGFFGESMFSSMTDASKVALASLVAYLKRSGFAFIDCQLSSPHILSLGALEIPRAQFLKTLAAALDAPNQLVNWNQIAAE